jgi:hypothetical protein
MDRGRVARSIVDRWWHGPKALERGGVLAGGGIIERGEHGEPGSGLTGA